MILIFLIFLDLCVAEKKYRCKIGTEFYPNKVNKKFCLFLGGEIPELPNLRTGCSYS